MTEGDMDELSQKLAGDDVSAEEMKERLDKTEVTQHEEEALVEITELFKEMKSVEGEERRKTSESIVQAAKRWPDKVAKHSEQLVDFVTDDNYYVRKNATFALGLVGDERHVEFLEKVAEKDDDLEDVARWSAKRIQTEQADEDEGVSNEDEGAYDGDEDEPVETRQIGAGSEADEGEEETREDTVKGSDSILDDDASEPVDASDDAEDVEAVTAGSSRDDGSTDESSTSREEREGSDSDALSRSDDTTTSGSREQDADGGRSSSTSGSGEEHDMYRQMAMTLYDQGDGHREAVEQAAVQVVSRNGSLQPLVEALECEGDEPLFAARALSRISEKEPGSLRDNVSVLSDLMSRKDGEVSDLLEETLVNVARETPESLVEELSKRD